jgi:hypothetical protein
MENKSKRFKRADKSDLVAIAGFVLKIRPRPKASSRQNNQTAQLPRPSDREFHPSAQDINVRYGARPLGHFKFDCA